MPPPALTRRRYPERQDCWHVYYGDVHVGTIARRTGCPVDVDQWEWACGFYPGTGPGDGSSGTAATFDDVRADFEAAWRVFLPTRTEADFQEWRDQRDWTAKKYAMWARGELFPSQRPNSMMTCPCGQRFDSHRLADNLVHVPHTPRARMKFAADRPYTDPEAAARKLVEIANSVEAVQDDLIHIEKINGPFLFELKGSPAEYSAGLKLAIERGWLWLHESGSYVKFTQAGAELFA